MSIRPLITVEVNTDALAERLDNILESLKTIADANRGHATERAVAEVAEQDPRQLVEPILDADTTNNSKPIQVDDPGAASQAVLLSSCPPSERKIICKDWLHHGTCSYPKCKWVHEMPQDLKALKREHLDAFPQWYVDKQAAIQGSLSGQAAQSSPVVAQPPDHSRVSEPLRSGVEMEIPAVIRDGATLDQLERIESQTYNLEKPFPTAKDVYEELCDKIQEGDFMHCSNLQVKLEICKGPSNPKASSKDTHLYRIPSLIVVDGRIPGLEDGYQLARGYGYIIINDDEEERMKCIEHLTCDLAKFTRPLPEGVIIPPELAIPFNTRQKSVVLSPMQSPRRSWRPAGALSWRNDTQTDELPDRDSPPSPAHSPGKLSPPMILTHTTNTGNTPVTSPSLPHDSYDEDCSLCHGERRDMKCHKCRHYGHLSLICTNPPFAERGDGAVSAAADLLLEWR